MKRKCRICECTDHEGCAIEGGCMWAEPDLCSTCYEMPEHLASYFSVAGPRAKRGTDGNIFQRVLDETYTLFIAPREPVEEPSVLVATEGDMNAVIAAKKGLIC